jgi:23S rRNA (adenine2503-C2)-methyltransferase
MKKPDIRSLNQADLQEIIKSWGEPAFRARQIFEWLWKKGVGNFDEMKNISGPLRERLKNEFSFGKVSIGESQVSRDRTIKNSFLLPDGNLVEGVLIPTSRMTACLSTQVGCSLTCKFCATGRLGRKRNLEGYEIFDQLFLIRNQAMEKYGINLSHVVYMGMGEPLLNYKEVLKSIEHICSPEGLGMSPQRITVSTAGIAKMIKKLGDDGVKFNLALSLHAADDMKRNEIMPINEENSLESLAEALRYFYDKTGTRVTFEYIVFRDFNDTPADARQLVSFAKKVPSKVNIIEYNPIEGGEFQQTSPERLKAFIDVLERNKIIVNVRRSRGKDIDAACGQLANKLQ